MPRPRQDIFEGHKGGSFVFIGKKEQAEIEESLLRSNNNLLEVERLAFEEAIECREIVICLKNFIDKFPASEYRKKAENIILLRSEKDPILSQETPKENNKVSKSHSRDNTSSSRIPSSFSVSGTITFPSGDPALGATVLLKGTTSGGIY